MKVISFLTLFLISTYLFANPDQRLVRANQLFENGDYRQAEDILNTFRPGNWHDKFSRYMILAELAYSMRETEKFRQYTDTARVVLSKFGKPGIWMSLVYRNYSRYHHYNIVKDNANSYADSALLNFYRYKNQQQLIEVYSIYQAKASALRNVRISRERVIEMFDSAFLWLNTQSHLSPYHRYSLNRSFGNFLLDMLVVSKYGTHNHDSLYRLTLKTYQHCSSILNTYYPDNINEFANVTCLMALPYFHHKEFTRSFRLLDKVLSRINQTRKQVFRLRELYYTCLNWQNSLADQVLSRTKRLVYRKKNLDMIVHDEEAWIRWTYEHRSQQTGTFRLMYSNNLYSAFLVNSYYLYKETADRQYLKLFYKALQRSKLLFFSDKPDDVIFYKPDVSDVQNYVSDSVAYVEYAAANLLYEHRGYIYVSTCIKDTIIEYGNGETHYELSKFSNTDSLFRSFEHFKRTSFDIYSQIFLPVQKLLPKSNKRVVIAPSNSTAFLNFDFLVTDTIANNYRSLSYLFYRYQFRYIPCLPVDMQRNKINQTQHPVKYAAVFAPVYTKRIHNLPFLRKHAEQLSHDGFTLYSGNNSDKQEFIGCFPKADIIEIAGHCQYDDNQYASDYRFMLASGGHEADLSISDLLALKTSCKLIVLALCETGQGELMRNDVSNHFSNYFIRSGALSTVYSISKLDDRSAAFILDRFYFHLAKGNYKDDALRYAKLDYLKYASTAAEFSPLYWAALILQGDNSPIYPGSQGHAWQWYPYMFCAILLLCLGIFISRWICR